MTRFSFLPAVGLAVLAVGVSSARVAAQNPSSRTYTVKVRINGQNMSGPVTFAADKPNKGNGEWVAGLRPWNNRNTTKNPPNPIWNADSTGIKFPIPLTGGGKIDDTDCDAYWDWYYITEGQTDYVKTWKLPKGTFKRISGAGFDQNCYGYASGKGYFMPRDTPAKIEGAKKPPNGFLLILEDEGWKKQAADIRCKGDCILLFTAAPLGDHAIVLKECCKDGYKMGVDSIRKTLEKNETGGVYEGTWDCGPGIDLAPKGEIWCKS